MNRLISGAVKYQSDILFWAGVAITLVGVTVGQSQRMPFVQRLINPAHTRAAIGEKTLLGKKSLVPEDDEHSRRMAARVVV